MFRGYVEEENILTDISHFKCQANLTKRHYLFEKHVYYALVIWWAYLYCIKLTFFLGSYFLSAIWQQKKGEKNVLVVLLYRNRIGDREREELEQINSDCFMAQKMEEIGWFYYC